MECFSFRPWRPQDRFDLQKNADHREVWDNVRDYFPSPYTLADADDFIESAVNKTVVRDFAVTVNDRAVGGIGYIPQSDVERIGAEIGYWLGPDYWNKGIMSGVLAGFIELITTQGEFRSLYASIFDFNTASMRVLEKAGFVKVGIRHRAAIKNGRITDMHIYERIL